MGTIEKPCSNLLESHHRSVNMSDMHGKMEMLVAWKQVMKSLLMGNVYNLCRV
jgi:hypothetical protein